MRLGKSGRWLIAAFGVFLGLLVIWVVAALQLNPAGAGLDNLGFDLRSRLAADYGADQPNRQVGVLRFSIIGDMMRGLGMAPQEAQTYEESMQVAMNNPVPTATARDFEGAVPFTATPTFTPIPTNTPTATFTPIPTNTPRPTRTPTKTSPPPTAVAPTAAPATLAPPDTVDPIVNPGWTFNAIVNTCAAGIVIDDVDVVDPAVSSGIDEVQIKYEVPGYVGHSYLGTMIQCSGGFLPDNSWQGCFQGTATFDKIYNGWHSTANSGPSDFTVNIYARPIDNAGNHYDYLLGSFTLPHTCDD
jgi:hypothetical protein